METLGYPLHIDLELAASLACCPEECNVVQFVTWVVSYDVLTYNNVQFYKVVSMQTI